MKTLALSIPTHLYWSMMCDYPSNWYMDNLELYCSSDVDSKLWEFLRYHFLKWPPQGQPYFLVVGRSGQSLLHKGHWLCWKGNKCQDHLGAIPSLVSHSYSLNRYVPVWTKGNLLYFVFFLSIYLFIEIHVPPQPPLMDILHMPWSPGVPAPLKDWQAGDG